MRRKFIWWPFHPAGYTLGTGFVIDDYWFTMIISSTLKLVILRYGGARVYRKSIPFFLGLVLGVLIVAALLAIMLCIVVAIIALSHGNTFSAEFYRALDLLFH